MPKCETSYVPMYLHVIAHTSEDDNYTQVFSIDIYCTNEESHSAVFAWDEDNLKEIPEKEMRDIISNVVFKKDNWTMTYPHKVFVRKETTIHPGNRMVEQYFNTNGDEIHCDEYTLENK